MEGSPCWAALQCKWTLRVYLSQWLLKIPDIQTIHHPTVSFTEQQNLTSRLLNHFQATKAASSFFSVPSAIWHDILSLGLNCCLTSSLYPMTKCIGPWPCVTIELRQKWWVTDRSPGWRNPVCFNLLQLGYLSVLWKQHLGVSSLVLRRKISHPLWTKDTHVSPEEPHPDPQVCEPKL